MNYDFRINSEFCLPASPCLNEHWVLGSLVVVAIDCKVVQKALEQLIPVCHCNYEPELLGGESHEALALCQNLNSTSTGGEVCLCEGITIIMHS